jgi:hypothetical protein
MEEKSFIDNYDLDLIDAVLKVLSNNLEYLSSIQKMINELFVRNNDLFEKLEKVRNERLWAQRHHS